MEEGGGEGLKGVQEGGDGNGSVVVSAVNPLLTLNNLEEVCRYLFIYAG